MIELSKKYDPQESEEKIYKQWEERKFFHAEVSSDKPSYCVTIPPPNVTGVLHMGHALNNTIQDILVRWKRMQGYETLWMPGTDHAGIATQNVVEKKLASEGKKRTEMGRDLFLQRVWEWKEEHGNTIIHQLKRLGCSCDWERERFTMDDGLSHAVKEVFVRLYNDGLIYKGDYIINWCPRCGTALSDEEAEHKEKEGTLYYVRYPVRSNGKTEERDKGDYLVVATTRPETMLGDTAIAVNPEDERYVRFHGKSVTLPVIGRQIPIICDKDVDPEFGTGALKVTPAHDPFDFSLGQKHKLGTVNVMHPDGTINSEGGQCEGMDRFECRKFLVGLLEKQGLLIKTEKHVHAVGHCYRCETVVEPRLSKQWFVRMAPLAKEALAASSEGKVKFHPKRWEKVYFNWMENIRDWCISRQIWWGHRIPVWYCLDCMESEELRDVEVSALRSKGVVVSGKKPDSCPDCGSRKIEQDPDVLDTWFSSWLWPVSTLGWPEDTRELKKFYPTDTLVTAQEIIFFWVARMIMAGMRFKGEVPFSDVYIHGTVRDDTGTKMSKSLGNVIDPLEIIEKFGCDALRYSIISITAQGQDVFLSEDKFEIGRNFANKLWNASRFVLMNLDEENVDGEYDLASLGIPEKWILHSLGQTIKKVTGSLEKFRFNDAAGELYEFIWHKYCDWYLEISKINLKDNNAQKVLAYVMDIFLRLLHPIMPFITENIWRKLHSGGGEYLMVSEWPLAAERLSYPGASEEMSKIIELIKAVRNIRAFWNIAHSVSLELILDLQDPSDEELYREHAPLIERLSGSCITEICKDADRPSGSVATLGRRVKVYIPLGEAIDLDKEKKRVSGKIQELNQYLEGIEKKLTNDSFIKKAPQKVVLKEKEKKETFSQKLKTLKDNIAALS